MLTATEVLTTAQMRALESAAIGSGAVTGLELMERAGAAVAGHIRLRWPKPGRVTVLCGPGNNGGDGYVIARHLAQAGWAVTTLALAAPTTPDARAMAARWTAATDPLTPETLRAPADLIVDAIFGTGLTRPLDLDLTALPAPVVAVDAPSGLDLDTGRILGPVPRAALTVTFHSAKPGHLLAEGPAHCGTLIIADIGLSFFLTPISPLEALTRTACATANLRKTQGHKFTHGHALILSGGLARTGAARLAARAALRIGAGLVTLAPPRSALIEPVAPDALMRRPIDSAEDLTEAMQDPRITALCLGPGCGIPRAASLLPALLASDRPCVLDADALTALADTPQTLHPACILTPHPGEFARLFRDLADAPSKLDATRTAAARIGATVVHKGPDTVIATPDGQTRIHSAFDVPQLATAGSGDVLAGLITGLLARGLPPLAAAETAVTLHAAAARHFGPGLIADDLPEQIPALLASKNPLAPRARPC